MFSIWQVQKREEEGQISSLFVAQVRGMGFKVPIELHDY